MGKPSPSQDEPEALDVVADVVDDVAKGFAALAGMLGKPHLAEKAEKIKKGAAAIRSGSDLKKKMPEVLRAAGLTYENSSFARLERMLREKKIVTDRPSHGHGHGPANHEGDES